MTLPAQQPSDIRVMVVDDSSIVRGMVLRTLESEGIQVVATAANAPAALAMLRRPAGQRLEPDILIVDVLKHEKAVPPFIPEIRQERPGIKIIVSATLNENNVLSSISALEAGADELVPKPSSRKNPQETSLFIEELLRKVKLLGGLQVESPAVWPLNSQPVFHTIAAASEAQNEGGAVETTAEAASEAVRLRKAPTFFRPKALAIASSTGGPKALQVMFEGIGKRITEIPIFLTQHMPKDFTGSLATQLGRYSGLPSAEARDGERVAPGRIYVAPGDYHMLIESPGGAPLIRLDQGPQENFCRPAADPMLRSLYQVYGKEILVVVLTGMGQDGMLGAKLIADNGGVVVAQDKETSVVWGMPGAVAKEGVCHHILPLPRLADAVVKLCNGLSL